MATIKDAARALDDRKQAWGEAGLPRMIHAALSQDETTDPESVINEGFGAISIGLDVDHDELLDVAAVRGGMFYLIGTLHRALEQAMLGAWSDGVLVGLMLAELRRQEGDG